MYRFLFFCLCWIFCSQLQAQVCFQRADPLITSYDSSSVTLHWSRWGSAVGVQIEYGLDGFNPGSGTRLQTTQSSITLTGLHSDTTYNVYLRDSCGPGVVSSWSNPLYVKLPSDTVINGLGKEVFAANELPKFWGNSGNTSNGFWKFIFPSFNSPLLAPKGLARGLYDHSDSINSGYAFSDAEIFLGKSLLSTPYFRLDSLQNPYLRFWMFRYDTVSPAGPYPLRVFAESGGQLIKILDYTGNSRYWKHFGLELDSLTSDTIRLIFEHERGSGFGQRADVLLDDVEVMNKPSCSMPNLEAVQNVSAHQATIIAENTGSAAQKIRFTIPGLGQSIYNTTLTDTFFLGSLPPATKFQFYLKDSCASGQESEWTGPWYFTTDCAPIPAPWYEPFYNESLTCYQNFGNTPSREWKIAYQSLNPYFSADFVKDHSQVGTQSTFVTARLFSAMNYVYLQIPEIDISGLTNPHLSFYLYSLNDEWYPDTSNNKVITVEIKDSTGQWQSYYRFRGNDTNWQYHHTSLGGVPDTLQLRFKAEAFGDVFSNIVHLDDIRIDEAPSCQVPDSLSVSNLNARSANFQWKGGSGNYVVEYGKAEFRHGSGNSVVTSGNKLNLRGLQPNTHYKFYLRSICGSDTSQYSLGKLFKTPCPRVADMPEYEDFEQERFDSTSLKNCWEILASSNLTWIIGTAVGNNTTYNSTGLPNTGPLQDPDSAYNRKYLYLKSSAGAAGDSSSLVTQTYDASKYQESSLSFMYHMYGSDMGDLKVKLDTGQVFTIYSLEGQQHSSDQIPWKKAVIALDSFNIQQDFSIIFTGIRTGGVNSEMALDNIRLTDSCLFDTVTADFQVNLDTVGLGAITYRFAALDSGGSLYIWDFGDGNVDTSFTPQTLHSYTSDSLYTVSLRVQDDCNAAQRSSMDSLPVNGVGTSDYARETPELEIFPNPARQEVTISMSLTRQAVARIYSLSGQLVRQVALPQGKATVSIQDLSDGVYLVEVQEKRAKLLVR